VLRYHQYALEVREVDGRAGRDLWEHRAHLFHVLPVEPAAEAAAPKVQPPARSTTPPAARASPPPREISPKRVALDLSGNVARDAPPILTVSHQSTAAAASGDLPRFVDFRHGDGDDGGGDSAGAIEMTEYGLQLNSSAGDFAEWHELLDHTEQLEEGEVVAITSGGKVTRTFSSGCGMAGVVSGRAVVTGSQPFWGGVSARSGVEIAYCGRVPVRCRGPVAEGDVLVASGASDGLARVSSNNQLSLDDCCVQPQDQHGQPQIPVGVALGSLEGGALGSVEVVVTPPSMAATAGLSNASSWLPSRRGGSKGLLPVVASVVVILVGLCLATVSVYVALFIVQQRRAESKAAAVPAGSPSPVVCTDDPENEKACEMWARDGECTGDRHELVRRHCPVSCKLCKPPAEAPRPPPSPPPPPPPPPPAADDGGEATDVPGKGASGDKLSGTGKSSSSSSSSN